MKSLVDAAVDAANTRQFAAASTAAPTPCKRPHKRSGKIGLICRVSLLLGRTTFRVVRLEIMRTLKFQS